MTRRTRSPAQGLLHRPKDAKVTIAKTEMKDGKTFATISKIEEIKK